MSKKLVVLSVVLCGAIAVPAGAMADGKLDLRGQEAVPVGQEAAPVLPPLTDRPVPMWINIPESAPEDPAAQGPGPGAVAEAEEVQYVIRSFPVGNYAKRVEALQRELQRSLDSYSRLRRPPGGELLLPHPYADLFMQRVGMGTGDIVTQPQLLAPVAVRTAEQIFGHGKQEGALPTYDE